MKSKVILDFGFGLGLTNSPRKQILRSVGLKYGPLGKCLDQTLGLGTSRNL